MTTAPRSSLARFDRLWRNRTGAELLGGVDEAGRGALAGPVVAACVVLAPGTRLDGLNDSKVLTPEEREALMPRILRRAVSWGVGWATAAEIDRVNILQATHLAAGRALARLEQAPQFLLTDFLKLRGAPCPLEAIVDGDAQSQAVAAASVLAKVARDRLMKALDGEYPQYGHRRHKGYGTPEHLDALARHGPSTLHRLTFNGVGFFDLVPVVRARSRPFEAGLRPVAAPDFLRVLIEPVERLEPWFFLPEVEWDEWRHNPSPHLSTRSPHESQETPQVWTGGIDHPDRDRRADADLRDGKI